VDVAETVVGVGGGDVEGVSGFTSWLWRPDPHRGYSVRDAYQLLTTQQYITLGAVEDLIWHRQVPLEVSIFAWRLLRDRLPTNSNLVTRDIITPESHFCVTGCSGIESARHLFVSCNI
jgi:hypothetical protein